MKSPTVSTLKTLFALSGNRCAFPNCTNRLVDEPSGTLVGKVCHIKGKSSGPGSKRYDKSQTDEERHSVENLIPLCPQHHDVVDDDEKSYTVDRLLKIKSDHEDRMRELPAASDRLGEIFAMGIHSNTVSGDSIIHTQSQIGGQTAHSIVNNYHEPSLEVANHDRQIYSELWSSLFDFRIAAHNLVDWLQDRVHQDAYGKFIESLNVFQAIVRRNEPFIIPQVIAPARTIVSQGRKIAAAIKTLEELQKQRDTCRDLVADEQIAEKMIDADGEQQEAVKEIDRQFDEVKNAIQNRTMQ